MSGAKFNDAVKAMRDYVDSIQRAFGIGDHVAEAPECPLCGLRDRALEKIAGVQHEADFSDKKVKAWIEAHDRRVTERDEALKKIATAEARADANWQERLWMHAELTRTTDAMQNDIAAALRALGLGDHARDASPHEVMVNEIIPAIAYTKRRLDKMSEAERTLSDAYLRIRSKLQAFDTPSAPTPGQIFRHTEAKLDELLAARRPVVTPEMREEIERAMEDEFGHLCAGRFTSHGEAEAFYASRADRIIAIITPGVRAPK